MTEKRVKYVSVEIQGETARRLEELQCRGLVSSTKDAVIQGINLLYERFLQMDLKVRGLNEFSRTFEAESIKR